MKQAAIKNEIHLSMYHVHMRGILLQGPTYKRFQRKKQNKKVGF